MYYLKQLYVFSNSYLPLFIIIFLSNLNYEMAFKEKNVTKILGENIERNVQLCLLIIISVIIILVIIDMIINKCETMSFSKDTKIQYTEYNFLNYFATFIIPLATFSPENLQSILLNLLLITFLFIFYIQTDSFYYNVFAMGLNRRIYKDQYNNFFISDYSLSEFENLLKYAESIKSKNINNKVHVVLKKYNK